MYYIRSQNRDIFDELIFNGKGYYPDGSNGTFSVNTNMITYSRVTTDKVVGGYIAFSSYTTGYFYMTFWDVKQQQIKTEKCTITNGLYYVKTAPYNADWVSLSFYNDQVIKEINKVGETYPLDAEIKHEQELNGDERIEVDIHYTDNNRKFLAYHEDLNMWLIEFEGKEYVIVSNTKKGYGDYQMVSCTAILYALFKLNTDRIYERYDEHLTVTEGLTLVFSGTPFTYINVGNAASEQFEGLGEGETRLEVLKTLIDRWGYEIKIVGDVFYFYDQVGNDTNFEYRYKINANDIEQASDANEMYTYARGYGDYSDDVAETTDETTNTTETSDIPIAEKANLKREYTSPFAKYIGKLHAPPIQDGRITKVETMDQKLYDLVENSITITFTANIVDMRENGYEYQSAVLGDRVFLVDERINVDREIRVIKIDRTLDANENIIDMEITFGTDSLADKYEAQFNTAIKDITDIMSGRKVIPFQSLDIVSRSMVNKIQNTSSELVFDDMGIHAIDKKNANNIVTMNSSGWMLSTDGGTTAKTALTAEGIVADAITTGTLNANLVKITGGQGKDYIEMNNEYFYVVGEYQRNWRNINKLEHGYVRIGNGMIRFRNEDTQSSLYMSHFGISTQLDTSNASGTLNFFDSKYSDFAQGVTLNSVNGVASLTSDNNRVVIESGNSANINSSTAPVYIRPKVDNSDGINEFNFTVANTGGATTTDGYIMYGSSENYKYGSGLRFTKNQSGKKVSIVDGDYATGQDTTIEAGIGEFNTVNRRGDNSYISVVTPSHLVVGNDAMKRVASDAIYARTYSAGANVVVTEEGTLGRSTSASKYKLAIENQFNNETDQLIHSRNLLDLNVKSWFDKAESEIVAEELKEGQKLSDDAFKLERHVGLIAEDVENVGLKEYVTYNSEGEIEGIQYDRLWVHLLPVLKDQQKRIEQLEGKTNG